MRVTNQPNAIRKSLCCRRARRIAQVCALQVPSVSMYFGSVVSQRVPETQPTKTNERRYKQTVGQWDELLPPQVFYGAKLNSFCAMK